MNAIIDIANKFFDPIIKMGGPIVMLIILTVLALLFGGGWYSASYRFDGYRGHHRYAEWSFLSFTCKIR